MQKWEYFVIKTRREGHLSLNKYEWNPNIDLTKYGDEGWELISVVPVEDAPGGYSGVTNQLIYYFKRLKE